MIRRRFREAALPRPVPASGAFLLYPVQALPGQVPPQGGWQQALYEWAFAEAQAVVQPSLPERDLLGVWN
jgi:hypothetical protein